MEREKRLKTQIVKEIKETISKRFYFVPKIEKIEVEVEFGDFKNMYDIDEMPFHQFVKNESGSTINIFTNINDSCGSCNFEVTTDDDIIIKKAAKYAVNCLIEDME